MSICVRRWFLIGFGLALCACTAPQRDDGKDDDPADAGAERALDPGPRPTAAPRLSARLAPTTLSPAGGASDTCVTDTSQADFQAGTLTKCDTA